MKIKETNIIHTGKKEVRIVTGIREPTIDPVRTQENIKPMAVQLPEHEAVSDLKGQIEKLRKDEAANYALHIQALEKEDNAKAQAYLDASRLAADGLTVKEEELREAEDAYLIKCMELYEKNPVYCNPAANQTVIEDAVAEQINEKIRTLKNNECLLEDGAVIPNCLGISYYLKENGKWHKRIVGEIGVTVPEGGFREEELTSEMREEISGQADRERIAGLNAEEKAKEKADALASAKSKARVKKEEADVADEAFDARAWFQTRKAEIEAMYA